MFRDIFERKNVLKRRVENAFAKRVRLMQVTGEGYTIRMLMASYLNPTDIRYAVFRFSKLKGQKIQRRKIKIKRKFERKCEE